MNKLDVTLILGFPSSGKTTLAKILVDKGYIQLSRDNEGGKILDLLPKVEDCLKNNKNVVMDNLFKSVDVRKPFIELAKKYNANIEAAHVETSMEDSMDNFCSRMIKNHGRFLSMEEINKSKDSSIFPPAVFFKYRKEFQKPTKEEGFDHISNHSFRRKNDPTFTNKAILLDYDSTLRECVGGNGKYPTEESHIKIMDNRQKVIQSYKDKGYLLLGVSNQSGVSKKELTIEKCDQLFKYTNKLLGFDIDYKFCPHQSAPISCYCRKPMNGIFVDFMHKYKLDRKQCLMVGDLTSDKTFAKRSGIEYIDQLDFFK